MHVTNDCRLGGLSKQTLPGAENVEPVIESTVLVDLPCTNEKKKVITKTYDIVLF